MEPQEKIKKRIKESKKYRPVYEKTINRIARYAMGKYGEKDAEKETRNTIHQIWGAYYGIRPNFKKVLEKFKKEWRERNDKKETLKTLLKLHSSTNERIKTLGEFYKEIFKITGIPDSIIDHACGLNPLAIFWMNLPKETQYYAFDIDEEEVMFLKRMLIFIN